jgi:hypothetical protein
MPTGYTQGILDGTTETFKDFASKCMRAFGAAMHMRDEGLDVEYRPAEPGSYHKEQIEKWERDLEQAGRKSAESFYWEQLETIKENISYNEKKIAERKRQRAKLDNMLYQVKGWTPPTEEHLNFKSFMQSQLEDTIRYDGDWEYWERELVKLKTSLGRFQEGDKTPGEWGEELRAERLAYIQEQIKYHRDHWNDDQKRCDERNQWIQTLLDSIN